VIRSLIITFLFFLPVFVFGQQKQSNMCQQLDSVKNLDKNMYLLVLPRECANWTSVGIFIEDMHTGMSVSLRDKTDSILNVYEYDNIQFISATFIGNDRPFCYWFADKLQKGYSQGRCDVDNDGYYEYNFHSDGPINVKLDFNKYWQLR